jgi:hypothetical protein
MNLYKLKSLTIATLVILAISCNGDEELPAFQTNNKVHPVDFLSENSYTTLNIEVAYVEGYQPNPIALSNLAAFLSQRLNKSGGVTVTQRAMPATGRLNIDLDAIRALEKVNRKSVSSGKTLTAWIMFLDTEYTESTSSSKILGITYGASSIAIFEKSVYFYVQPDMPSRAILETVIMDHEFGHILGLVDNGTSMVIPHKDLSHGSHCSNTTCLMYWKTEENVNLADLLGTDTYPTLDANCLADLKAAGGK